MTLGFMSTAHSLGVTRAFGGKMKKKMVRPFGLYGRKSRFSKKVLSATDVLTLKQKCLNVLLFQHTEVRQKVENLCYVQL